MNEERAKRKLSAIFSADAVGYSRLMQEDEALTIRILEDSKELMTNFIQQYRGRVVDAPGDNLLAEFASIVDATECAVKIQRNLRSRNADLPDNSKMEFRIGINLGDVVEEGGRIYGDGVNIAARIEGFASPGGICISQIAFDQVKNKLKFGYEYLGEHSIKNIAAAFKNSSQIWRISHHLLKGYKKFGADIHLQRDLVIFLINLISSMKYGDPFNEDGSNIVYDEVTIKKIINETDFNIATGISSKKFHQFSSLLWSFTEAMLFIGREICGEIHGPYKINNNICEKIESTIVPEIKSGYDLVGYNEHELINQFYQQTGINKFNIDGEWEYVYANKEICETFRNLLKGKIKDPDYLEKKIKSIKIRIINLMMSKII